jgi:dolichol-phosphate mannosyltransferase
MAALMSCEFSLVIPVFNEAETLPVLMERVTKMLKGLTESYELIFVDDGSCDNSVAVLEAYAAKDPRVKVLQFARNFGHQVAITAGLDYASGDATVVMDSDLQDPPEVIPKLWAKWKEGYDVVFAVRERREGETWFKLATASAFYRLLRRMTEVDIPADAGDFRLLSRGAREAFCQMREKHRFVRGMTGWIGFRQTGVPYKRESRHAGETKYPFRKMFRLAVDAITGFSLKPLKFATYLGLIVSGLSFLYMLFAIYQKLSGQHLEKGWASLIVSIYFLGGVQLLTIGIVGEYVGRIYEESKHRPLYLVRRAVGFDGGTPNRK